jgi:hypothetical protein
VIAVASIDFVDQLLDSARIMDTFQAASSDSSLASCSVDSSGSF